MTLAAPFWLILLIPWAMLLWLWRLPSRLLWALRIATLTLLLLALCGLSLVLPARSGTVVLVADRSLSMPADSDALEKEAADLVYAAMPADDKLAVVSFAERAAVEQSPQGSKFAGFSAEVGRDASRLADALDLALSLVGSAESGRILLLSDGQWTGRDVSAAAARAAAAAVPIDYRAIERSAAGDLAIERIQAPESVLPGESFMITAWIASPLGQTIAYDLRRGTQTIARGSTAVPSGTSRLVFRDTAGPSGVSEYVLHVEAPGVDPVPGNNRARLLVGVRGARPLLCVPAGSGSGLPGLLAKGGVNLHSKPAADCRWSLEDLAGYSAVVLENTPAGRVGHVGMQNLAAWVEHSGGGLMLTGGRDSFGSGGYFKSPLEPLLPVSMELRREHRKLSLAIVVALDRSGSMAIPCADGRPKIDLADLATAEVLNMLGPMDQFGCLAVDTVAHEIVPLSDAEEKERKRERILRIDSEGGGIYIYEALVAAAAMIQPAKAGTRHIILFADATDAEHPGDWASIVGPCAKAGITVSVVGLGTEHDCDAELLRRIARLGGGQCMFTNVAQELPRLFAQDTCVIARSAFIDEATAVRSTGGMAAISSQPLGRFPGVGGYNLCYLRPGANLALRCEDEYQAPLLAAWQAGLGRALCYTGEADGKYTGPLAGWSGVGDFFASLARWTAGKQQGLGPGVVATQELRRGVCRVELHLDPERQAAPFTRLPELTTLSARPGESATSKTTRMSWSSPDCLLAEVPLAGGETVLTTVEAAGAGQTTLAPMCLSYSPEYLPQKPGQGTAALEQLARATGGCQRLNLAGLWQDIPRRPRSVPLAPYLLPAAVVLFLLEVLQRRTGLLAVRWRPWRRRRAATARAAAAEPQRMAGARPAAKTGKAPPPVAAPAAAAKPADAKSADAGAETADSAINEALSQARRRAGRRTKRTS
ncbi:MAG: VWA domain-containing protein [Thermoguttaceae bacterium]|jgi:Mg-chelatase subunit ChlD